MLQENRSTYKKIEVHGIVNTIGGWLMPGTSLVLA